ncbi:MAG: PD-(D/E)XK nuclease family transposase [Oscillospiraceae bacterium]|nr:PD-(D/E)XK nuclease family transposase [Oscillospiraceae bacterium]
MGKHPNKDKPLELWLQLINAETEEELQMLEQTNVQEISQAILVLRELSADEKMRYMAEMREKALHDEATAIHAALEKGMAQGLEQGIARGMKKGLEKGLAQGMAQGLKQGIAQGLEQGIAEERQRMIENLRKFGLSEEQIQAALHAQENP